MQPLGITAFRSAAAAAKAVTVAVTSPTTDSN